MKLNSITTTNIYKPDNLYDKGIKKSDPKIAFNEITNFLTNKLRCDGSFDRISAARISTVRCHNAIHSKVISMTAPIMAIFKNTIDSITGASIYARLFRFAQGFNPIKL